MARRKATKTVPLRTHIDGISAPVAVTPEWRNHHDVETRALDRHSGRSGQQLRTTQEMLCRQGHIGDAERAAADRWYEDYVTGIEGVTPSVDMLTGIRSSSRGDGMTRHRLDALTAYRQASQAIGMQADALLQAALVDGLAMRALARRFGWDDRVTTGRVVAALVRLTEHYAEVDRGRAR